MKITVIISALNESSFIQPCIKAVYNFAGRIKIQTNFDRSWKGRLISPDDTVNKILEFPDKKGKISLFISRIPDEGIARNWLMRSDGYRIDHKFHSTTSSETDIKEFCESPDYFWIIDADEIYDPETIPAILDYLADKKPKILKVRGVTYFKSWNYKVTPSDNFYQPGFIKRGVLFHENRWIFPPGWFRLIRNKYWYLGKPAELLMNTANRLGKIETLPEEIAVFHHGSYVGDDQRIFNKIASSVHHDELLKDWYENVWKKWTPDSKNLHPKIPEVFASLEYVPANNLPSSIKDESWPDGYIER